MVVEGYEIIDKEIVYKEIVYKETIIKGQALMRDIEHCSDGTIYLLLEHEMAVKM